MEFKKKQGYPVATKVSCRFLESHCETRCSSLKIMINSFPVNMSYGKT